MSHNYSDVTDVIPEHCRLLPVHQERTQAGFVTCRRTPQRCQRRSPARRLRLSHRCKDLDSLKLLHSHKHREHTCTLCTALIYWISLSEVLRWCLVAAPLPRSEPSADPLGFLLSGLCVIIFYIYYAWKGWQLRLI